MIDAADDALKKVVAVGFLLGKLLRMAITDWPLEDFMNPKKALAAGCPESLKRRTSVPAPQRLMESGALGGSEPNRSGSSAAARPQAFPMRTYPPHTIAPAQKSSSRTLQVIT